MLASLLIALALAGAPDDVTVIHAEPPVDTPLARVMEVTARVQVTVEPDGTVSRVDVLQPEPPFVARISKDAACRWRFAPSSSDARREYVVTFVYGGVDQTDDVSGRVVT